MSRELTWLKEDDSQPAMRHKLASSLSSFEELLVVESSLSSYAMYARFSFGFFSFFLSTLFSFSLLAFRHSILICPYFPQL